MNFNNKGWLSEYYHFRLQNPFSTDLPTKSIRLFENNDTCLFEHQLYSFIQPTGLFYGHVSSLPFSETDYPGIKYLDSNDKALLSFIDVLFSSLFSNTLSHLNNSSIQDNNYKKTFEEIIHFTLLFFNSLKGNDEKKEFNDLNPDNFSISNYSLLEEFLNTSLFFDKRLLSFRSYSQNKFIFLDYYFCLKAHSKYLTQQNKITNFTEIKNELTSVKIIVLRLMIIAAHSSGTIETQEKKMFKELFLTSRLPDDIQNQLENEFQSGNVIIQEVPLTLDWLLKRYFLEMCIQVIMSDKVISKDEDKFLSTITNSLHLTDEDLSQSYIAMTTYLTLHEKELDFINRKYGFFCFSDKLKEAATLAISKNKDRLVTEIRESKELYQLLLKSRSTTLTEEERHKVKEQLMDIIKSIPTLVALILPGAFITLPILLKLLPKNMFPSAFRE